MKIEKLTENQIKITLNINDLNENNINLHSFMSNSLESQDLFYLILDKAEKEFGFKTDNYKLMIEVLSVPGGNFILTITRIQQDQMPVKKNFHAKRKEMKYKDNIFIYRFKTFDDFCEFGTSLRSKIPGLLNVLNKSKLFEYNSNYYFVLKNTCLDISEIKRLHCMFLEFSEYIHNSKFFERKLNEYGKIIIQKDVLSIINKYF